MYQEKIGTYKEFMLGNEAIARAAIEAGVKVVAGYPGTPATEIVDHCAADPGVYAEWAANEKHAFEVVGGASLTNQRAMAVMKHNGTNAATDYLMHINFTGIQAGTVLISADDPGALSSQCEEDTRVLIHTYAHLPMLDPSTVQEAYDMTKMAFDLSEKTQLVWALRPVMRINHAGTQVTFTGGRAEGKKPDFIIDRSRFVMSAVVEKELGGELRPKMRHRWLNEKQAELKQIVEDLPFNWTEDGEGDVGFVACGIGYAFLKEAEEVYGKKLPILKLSTLPLPEKKVLAFVKRFKRVVVFEEVEPVVEKLIQELCFENKLSLEVLGRDTYLPAEGELSTTYVLAGIKSSLAGEPYPAGGQGKYIPARTRTQCAGCSHRGLLVALRDVIRRNKGVVLGDIGCHDAGTFYPMRVQATIYCMGSSIPMAHGVSKAGFEKPVYALIGDSTFFHNGLTGLASAIANQSNITVIVAYNSTTAMTGFQPHPGSTNTLKVNDIVPIEPGAVAEAMGAKVFRCNPYDVEKTVEVLNEATKEPGVKVVVAEALCYLKFGREGRVSFTPKKLSVNEEVCNACGLCVQGFGCPAITLGDKAVIDANACNGCGVCVYVCKRGAIA